MSSPGVDALTLKWAMAKLALAFPASFPDQARTDGVSLLWRELLDQHPWITSAVFGVAIYRIAWGHKEDFAPGPAVALDYFREAEREERRTREQEEQRRALAAPPPSATAGWSNRPGPGRAAFLLHHLAIGKLKARGNPEPTEETVAEAAEAIRRSGFMRQTLVRIAAGEDVAPGEFATSLYEPTRRSTR